jgi:hypothetical protein
MNERRPTAPQSPQSFLTHRSTAIDTSTGIQANYYDGKSCASINCALISSAQRTQIKLRAFRLQKTPPNISDLFAKDPSLTAYTLLKIVIASRNACKPHANPEANHKKSLFMHS